MSNDVFWSPMPLRVISEDEEDDDGSDSSSVSSSSSSSDSSDDSDPVPALLLNSIDESKAAPVALQPELVPEDVICIICMTLPLEPVLTPCDHVFCSGCIHQALDGASQCPIDRTDCSTDQLRPLQGFAQRIWNNIQVKCGNHGHGCAWTGSIGDFYGHMDDCNNTKNKMQSVVEELEKTKMKLKVLQGVENSRMERLQAKYNRLKSKNEDLVEEIEQLRDQNEDLEEEIEQLREGFAIASNQRTIEEDENKRLRGEIEEINKRMKKKDKLSQKEIRRLEKRVESVELRNATLEQEFSDQEESNASLRTALANQPKVPYLFDGTYYYRREDVVQLSQLISMHLVEKPRYIDSNRIFNCVRSCYVDLQKGYKDNPRNYRTDMKMLLATCEASTWFTDRQRDNFTRWYQEQF